MFSKNFEELTPVDYNDTSIKFIAFYPTKNQNCFRLHWHKRIEIIRIRQGEMKIRMGNTLKTAGKDDIAIFFPGTPHEGFTEDSEAIYDGIMFELSILKNNTFAYKNFIEPFELNYVIFHEIISDPEILQIINDLIKINYTDDLQENKLSSLYMLGLIYTLFGKFYEKYGNNLKKTKRSESAFGKVIDYINKNYDKNITTLSVSEQFGYNESYFSRRFKELTGISSAKYIRIMRLERAKKLLADTNMPISEVAKQSGFNDTNYFNRCFKEYYGTAPTKFYK